jgi:pre-mRNA-splicing factor 38A
MTDIVAKLAHGTNPQYLLEKILRERIYESRYWKESCFGINAASLLDRAYELQYVGGAYANSTPTPFLALALKLLQIFPEREVIREYVVQKEFKYIRALGAFDIRLTWPARDIYQVLEPLLQDGRKLRYRKAGTIGL